MTDLQVKYWTLQEEARANREQERLKQEQIAVDQRKVRATEKRTDTQNLVDIALALVAMLSGVSGFGSSAVHIASQIAGLGTKAVTGI